jgi:hypothetical protein
MRRALQQGETPRDILDETEEAAQWWEQLLYATGGKLELEKCFFYLVYWVFDDEGEPRLLQVEDYPKKIVLVDSASGGKVEIAVKASEEAHKTLGVMQTPSGETKAEYERLYQKAKGLGQKVATAGFTPYEAS